MLAFTVPLLILVSLSAGCPYNCSSTPAITRGVCNLGVCTCLPGWGGDYCRWMRTVLSENQLISNATISTSDWAYYELNITRPAPVGLLVLNVAAINSNIGLFPLLFVSNSNPVNRNLFPSMYSYLFCNMSFSVPNKTMLIYQPDPSLRWMVGVSASPVRGGIGYVSYYQISWTVVDVCPNDCHSAENKGQCGEGGVCNCTAPFTGTDCSKMAENYTYGEERVNLTTTPGWRYYVLRLNPNINDPKSTLISILISGRQYLDYQGLNQMEHRPQLGAGAGSTIQTSKMVLFVRKGDFPTLVNYDYVIPNLYNFHRGYLSIIFPNGIGTDVYYVGIWGDGLLSYNTTRFSFIANLSFYCPNGCSGHGYCNAGTCSCDPNWQTLSDCSLYIRNIDSIPYEANDNIGIREWRYYTVTQPLSAPYFLFTMTMDFSPPIDNFRFLIYLAFDELPNRLQYEVVESCSFSNSTNPMICDMYYNELPVGSTVNIGIFLASFAGTSISFSFQVENFKQCPNSCNGNPQLCATFSGICNCPVPYNVEPDCSISQENVSVLTRFERQVGGLIWNFYLIDITNYYNTTSLLTQFKVYLKTGGSVNPVDIYFRKSLRPTDLSYDLKINANAILNVTTGAPILEQLFYSQSSIIQPATWFIGVYNPQNTTVNYELSTNSIFPVNNQCNYPSCVCPTKKLIGPTCSWPSNNISFDTKALARMPQANFWLFYSFNVTESLPFVVSVIEDTIPTSQNDQIGVFDVFLKKNGQYPQRRDYDYANTNNQFMNQIPIASQNSLGSWVIGITTSEYFLRARNLSVIVSTGCQAYRKCGVCLADVTCSWCLSGIDIVEGELEVPSLSGYLSNFQSKCVNKTLLRQLCPQPWIVNASLCGETFPEYQVKGRMVGGLVGGLLLFFLLVTFAIFYIRKRGFQQTRDTVIAALNAPVSFFPDTTWTRTFTTFDEAQILSDPETVPIFEESEIHENADNNDKDRYQNIFNANFNLINDDESDGE